MPKLQLIKNLGRERDKSPRVNVKAKCNDAFFHAAKNNKQISTAAVIINDSHGPVVSWYVLVNVNVSAGILEVAELRLKEGYHPGRGVGSGPELT